MGNPFTKIFSFLPVSEKLYNRQAGFACLSYSMTNKFISQGESFYFTENFNEFFIRSLFFRIPGENKNSRSFTNSLYGSCFRNYNLFSIVYEKKPCLVLFLKNQATAPPQLLPAPAVQPKQCWFMTISRFVSSIPLKLLMCLLLQSTFNSSIWLKSQSYM